MKATLEVTMDNAAFDGLGGPHVELARILRDAADRLDAGHSDGFKLRDINGNTVGSLEIFD
jgi:hypothetical protein